MLKGKRAVHAVCFQRVEEVACCEVPDPVLEAAEDALVAVEWAGLCGSDLHPFFGREAGLDPGTVMGHELVGRVVAVGDAVRRIREGDRVAAPFSTNCGECFYCRRGLTSRCERGQLFGWRHQGRGLHGCQATLVRVPLADTTLFPVPPTISDRAALLLGDNLPTGFFCADLAGVGSETVAAVIGCGTVGLISILAARLKGAERVIAVDTLPHRRAVAEQLGAIPVAPEHAVDAIGEVTAGRGADAVLELVGLPAAQKLAYQLIRPGGVMAVIGCHCTANFAFSPVEAYDKNLTYRTGRCPARQYMDSLGRMLEQGRLQLDFLINQVFELADCRRAYEVFANRQSECLKAALRVGG